VCHQTVSLAARMLEANGIATVVMGCAKDIVERVGVPRFSFSDFPLGNAAAGRAIPLRKPRRSSSRCACSKRRPAPRTTMQSPLVWNGDPDWKRDYCNIDCLTADEIAYRRAEFDKGKAEAKALRD
jgi:hypothetical protein